MSKRPKYTTFPRTKLTLGPESTAQDKANYMWYRLLMALARREGTQIDDDCLYGLGGMFEKALIIADELPALQLADIEIDEFLELSISWNRKNMGASITYQHTSAFVEATLHYCMSIGPRIIPGGYDWCPDVDSIPQDLKEHLLMIEEA